MHEGIMKDFFSVLGEVPQPRDCLQAIQPVLRPGGLLSITEIQGDPDALGQVEVQRLAHQCGFSSLETVSLFKGFTLNFTKSPCSEQLTPEIGRF
jgi:hypothetical protein